MSNYTVLIFQQAGSTIDPYVSSIVMGVVQLIGAYTASQLMDRVGRRKLLLISTSGGFIALLVTGAFVYLHKQGFDMSSYNMLPVISISFYVFICVIGILPVPFVMVSELLPQRVYLMLNTLWFAIESEILISDKKNWRYLLHSDVLLSAVRNVKDFSGNLVHLGTAWQCVSLCCRHFYRICIYSLCS